MLPADIEQLLQKGASQNRILCEVFGFRAPECEMRYFAVFKDSMHETVEELATEINITNLVV